MDFSERVPCKLANNKQWLINQSQLPKVESLQGILSEGRYYQSLSTRFVAKISSYMKPVVNFSIYH